MQQEIAYLNLCKQIGKPNESKHTYGSPTNKRLNLA